MHSMRCTTYATHPTINSKCFIAIFHRPSRWHFLLTLLCACLTVYFLIPKEGEKVGSISFLFSAQNMKRETNCTFTKGERERKKRNSLRQLSSATEKSFPIYPGQFSLLTQEEGGRIYFIIGLESGRRRPWQTDCGTSWTIFRAR